MVEQNAPRGARGVGLATIAADGRILEVRYRSFELGEVAETGTTRVGVDALAHRLSQSFEAHVGPDSRRNVETVAVATSIEDLSSGSIDLCDTYLRLHILSARLLGPGQVSLEGILDNLADVAWTSIGPCLPDAVDEARWRMRADGDELRVHGLWPFPRMTDYVVPSGVRIMNADNVRLGAFLAPGTWIGGTGFCNTGAVTHGKSFVEGVVSLGVAVGEGSHIGANATLMGITSGGGKMVVSTGRNCLVGANAVLGIAVGDDCIVEAGCAVTPGQRVRLSDGSTVKASTLSGRPGLLYRRNSVSGCLEALTAPSWVGLNERFHKEPPAEVGR